jgi:AAA family ATP:ADP antiporter
MMVLTTGLLVPSILLTWKIHRLDLRECRERTGIPVTDKAEPLRPCGGFKLIFRSRYLLLIALMMGLYNFINALGEYMFSALQQNVALRELGTAATGGMDLQKYIGVAFAGYQSLGNIIGLAIQLFLVSRIFCWVGVAGALLFLPVIALGGYGYAAFGASLVLMKWIKAIENGMDYSLMKTARSALFLITSREEKYKAQAAIETFFVRGGDALCAAVVWLGTAVLALSIRGLAAVNAAAVILWIYLCIEIIKENRKIKASSPEGPKTKERIA